MWTVIITYGISELMDMDALYSQSNVHFAVRAISPKWGLIGMMAIIEALLIAAMYFSDVNVYKYYKQKQILYTIDNNIVPENMYKLLQSINDKYKIKASMDMRDGKTLILGEEILYKVTLNQIAHFCDGWITSQARHE